MSINLYERNIVVRLFLFRISFFVLAFTIVYLFKAGLSDYAAVLFFILTLIAIFPVTGLTIHSNALHTRQYFFFGLFIRKVSFEATDGFTLIPYELELDGSWDMIPSIMPSLPHSFNFRKFIIKSGNITKTMRQVKLKLSEKELRLIREYFGSSIC